MSHTLRFPLLAPVAAVGPAETSLVITLLATNTQLDLGGTQLYQSIAAWKTIMRGTEAPFPCVVIEFSANMPVTIGDGTFDQQIGLYGGITQPGTPPTVAKFLLGVLGIARGGVAPQIPIVQQAVGDVVGYAQAVANVAAYDSLSVGGVANDIPIPEGVQLTIRARPLRVRDYLG